MSLAHPDWATQFPTKPQIDNGDKSPCKDNKELPQCHRQWQAHAKANIKAHSEGVRPGNKYIGDSTKRSAEGQAATLTLAAITEHARHLVEQHATDIKPAIEGDKARIDGFTNKAVFGQDPTCETGADTCKTLTGSSWQQICKGDNVGDSICSTLACICSKESGTMTIDIFSETTTRNIAADAANPTAYTNAGNALINICEANNKGELNPAAIRTAVSRPRQMWKTFATGGAIAVYLGTKGAAANCGKQANCPCAEFSKFAKHKTSNVAAATGYEANPEAAAQELEKTLAAGAQQNKVIAKMTMLRRQAEAVFNHFLSTVPAHVHTSGKLTPATGTGTPNRGCSKHTNKMADECKTFNCNHDAETEKFKAKSGKGDQTWENSNEKERKNAHMDANKRTILARILVL
uniref:Variant surface glycoprotein n=1 Tax=Trypanosoma brucei TaxID=5691 RepID=A0A1V0FYB7_9TRYP|nr:variant surface glycoprotein [Trypanosoma brucei]